MAKTSVAPVKCHRLYELKKVLVWNIDLQIPNTKDEIMIMNEDFSKFIMQYYWINILHVKGQYIKGQCTNLVFEMKF